MNASIFYFYIISKFAVYFRNGIIIKFFCISGVFRIIAHSTY